MAKTLIKTSFAAGELSPSLNGRVDLAKYAVGAAVMRNFFVDYRGGASTRPGTQHVGRCRLMPGDPAPVLMPFVFNSDQAYVLELNENLMRVIYKGGYITHNAVAVTGATRGTQTFLTVPGHTFVTGDFVQVSGVAGMNRPNGISGVNGRIFYIEAVIGNDIYLADYGVIGTPGYVSVVSTTWTARTSGGTVARIYEIATPWASGDLLALNFAQSADVLTVVHPDYPAYDIRRLGNANWQIVQQTYGAQVAPPTPSAAAVNNIPANPQYFFAYVVTVVDSNGRESNASAAATVVNKALDQNASPNVVNRITYAAVAGAYKYRIYKAQPVPNGQQGGGPYFYGLIGNTFDTVFVDVNFAPEYDTTPPQARNPFLDKSIAAFNINSPGSGYVSPYLVISDASGSGASISLTADLGVAASPYGKINGGNVVLGGTNYTAPTATVLDAAPLGSGLVLAFSGAWVANPLGTGFNPAPGSITITNGGSNYHRGTYTAFVQAIAGNRVGTNRLLIDVTQVVNGVVTAISWTNAGVTPNNTTGMSSTGTGDTLALTIVGSDTAGSGAAVALTLGGTTNPSCVAYFEQRRVFAASRAKPASFWMSKPGQFTNFDVSDPQQDDDAISAALYAQEVNAIASLVAVQNGLMALTSGGAYLISGGTADAAVTPSQIKAPPQAFSGAQPGLRPLRIGDHVLYAQARGSGVRDLAFNFYSNNFTGQDISVLSAHLLQGRKIVQWCYAEEPLKMLWAVRDDGVLLSLTYLKEQEVIGWARHDTAGRVVSIVTVPEDREDAIYMIVHRYTPGYGFRYAVERMASRMFGENVAANIPPQPELAWCVDGGAQYPLTTYNTAITSGVEAGIGELYVVTVDAPGSNYVAPQAVINDISGTGGVVTLTVSGGQITGAVISAPGANYVAPEITIIDTAGSQGSGASLSLRVVNKVLFTFEAAAFSSADIGKVLRARGGRGVVLSSPSTTQLLIDVFQKPAPLPNIQGYVIPRVEAGDWSLTAPVTTIGGLDHLNNAVVQVLCDGNAQSAKTVVDGCITLDQAGTLIIVGQGFTAQLQTMRMEAPGETQQGKRKLIPAVAIRAKDTLGLLAGSGWDRMTAIKDRTTPSYMGEAGRFEVGGDKLDDAFTGAPAAYLPWTNDDIFLNVETSWDVDGIICIQQSYPLPATILALMPDVLEGDTAR